MSVLRARVRDIIADTDLADPQDIAATIIADLNPDDYPAVLAEALPQYVRQIMGAYRMQSHGAIPPSSAKVDAVRAWWARVLSEAVDVSGGGGEWKRLGDCTAPDLLAVATFRREMAARNMATARQYEALAARLDEAGCKTVADLDPADAGAVFGRAA